MKKQDGSVFLSFVRRSATLALGFTLALLASRALGQASPILQPINLDPSTTACQGLRVAARGPERVVVGWAPSDPARGICFRQRLNYRWEPIMQVGGSVGSQPRDLCLAFDQAGRLNMVWTALEGRSRRIFFTRLGDSKAPPQAAVLPVGPAGGDADFPAIAPDSTGGIVIVWQESREMRFSIRACRVLSGGGFEDMGRVSGTSLSGLSPQILMASPGIQVAWYEVNESGSDLRVDEWHPEEHRWRPAATEREAGAFPQKAQLLLDLTTAGMLACWQDVLGDGNVAIKLGLKVPSAAGGAPELITRMLADPPGKHTRPTFSGTLPGRLTLTWQVVAQGRQMIRIASLQQAQNMPLEFTISQPEQRFAAMPAHATLNNFTWVVWTDDVHEGGSGGIYFSQIAWPSFP